MNAQIQQLEAMNDQSMVSGKQTKKRPPSKMAPFPNTVHNADSMNENTFEQWCDDTLRQIKQSSWSDTLFTQTASQNMSFDGQNI